MTLLISKSIALLLLPPSGLILLAALGLLFWKYRGGKELVVVSMLLLWLLSLEPVRDVLIMPLENHYAALNLNQSAQQQLSRENIAIVLLGGGVYEKAPEFGGRDALSSHALMRTVYAANVARKTGLDVYSTGGALSLGEEPEGKVMNRWLIKFGVDPTKVFREGKARTTWENAANLKNILNEKNIKKIILVTTAWHMPRAVHVFKAQGFDVIAAPCAFVSKRNAYNMFSLLPQAHVLADSSDALHEYMGMLWYQWVHTD
ncbi:MAG: YdcF family protein [Mariprofundaceae bacterium]|nr:YdcF family protein [Mariprofundaceae bacterium]